MSSRYPAAGYPNHERSRSPPPRFGGDRRPSAAAPYSSSSSDRPAAQPRTASDAAAAAAGAAPRGPRSQHDPARPPLTSTSSASSVNTAGAAAGTLSSSASANPAPSRAGGYGSLREAPPLGAGGDRGRNYRDQRDFARDRLPSPRDRDRDRERERDRDRDRDRDYPPRDLDIGRSRRDSREGPLSAGSTYSSENQPFGASSFRGSYASRGRARGDFGYRGARGGRPPLDDRDLFRRDRSPPRWNRDHSRDGRDPERRDDRRFDRREDERRSDWNDRDRDFDRGRRESVRMDPRPLNDPVSAGPPAQALTMDPARRAMLESSGADTTIRRPSTQQDSGNRRDQLDTTSYLTGRAETTANRYGARGSSSPTQAPPVPAFTLSFGTSAGSNAPPTGPAAQTAKSTQEAKAAEPPRDRAEREEADQTKSTAGQQSEGQTSAPRAAPPPPRAQQVSPPPAAPKAPQALRNDDEVPFSNRLQGVRSLESLPGQDSALNAAARNDSTGKPSQPLTTPVSPASTQRRLPSLNEPVSPSARHDARFGEIAPPTGPRATRMSPGQHSVSPRPPFTSPRSDVASTFPPAGGIPRHQTPPPPSAPSGPRNKSFSVSPKAATSSIPTAPKADRAPPVAPRGLERGAQPPSRPGQSWAPPSAPRSLQQQQPWNQWRRAPVPAFPDRGAVPSKRDAFGEEKGRVESLSSTKSDGMKTEERPPTRQPGPAAQPGGDPMDVDRQPHKGDHSARQSFFGQPAKEEDEDDEEDVEASDLVHEPLTSSDEDESDLEDDITLFNAKFDRQKRHLESSMIDLSRREYRATTPLESIARLARISVQDWERYKEQKANEMEVDDSPPTPRRFSKTADDGDKEPALARTTDSSDSGDASAVLTPKTENEARVAIRSNEDESSDHTRRARRRPSPKPISLPYLLANDHYHGGEPLSDSSTFQDVVENQEASKSAVLDAMAEEFDEQENEDDDIEEAFARAYRLWREECEDLDREREDLERLEREQSLEPGAGGGADLEAASTLPPASSAAESRRLHISSEYEMLKILKESEEMARVEQERQDREEKKIRADMEKEAIVPDQLTPEMVRRSMFIDQNRFRDAESLTLVFTYEPPTDDFDDNEQAIFTAAFRETPKKWGEIASLLPNRSYKDCIHHYYATKWDGRFRDWKGRKYNGRRGRGGKGGGRGRLGGLMADLARTEALTDVSDKGRPRRAAAPTTFGEKEIESKSALAGVSPAKKGARGENSDAGSEKPGKRQKRTGEKPGRKPKNPPPQTQPPPPPAALAAPTTIIPPGTSPNKQFPPAPAPPQDEFIAKQKLEEASLLTGLHAGYHDRPLVYQQDAYMHMVTPSEELDRVKVSVTPASKPNASSYWSVPEQNDFVKYIGHFGRDFGAIAMHMGTKTTTMIKNQFQRQIDSGNRPELLRAANEADDRRARGEDIGPPPTPTPIQKRKYEQPQPTQNMPPRALAPHGDPMDVDEVGPSSAAARTGQLPKHVSPPQYHPQLQQQQQHQSRYPGGPPPQGTPIQAARVAASPHLPPSAPALSQGPPPPQQVSGRPVPPPQQHPLAQRLSFQPEIRPEQQQQQQPPHPQTIHSALDAVARAQQQQQNQSSRRQSEVQDPGFIKRLEEQQEQALRVQQKFPQELTQQERIESLHRQASLHRNSQGSPLGQGLHGGGAGMQERKPLFEERAPSPSQRGGAGLQSSAFSRPNFDPTSRFGGGPAGRSPFPTLGERFVHDPPPPTAMKREDPRPGSVPAGPLAPAPAQQQPAQEPPKRSNLLSLLNSEPEEPAPRAKENPGASLTSASPAPQQGFGLSGSSTPSQRRDAPFGQPSYSQPPFHRAPFGQPSSTPGPTSASLAHDHPSGGPLGQAKADWASRVLSGAPSATPPPSTSTLDRGNFFSHRSNILGSLNQPTRANPSPPPAHPGMGHSRTPSLSGPPGSMAREQQQRSGLSGGQQQQSQQQQQHQPLPPNIQPNPYASQNSSPYTQPLQPAQPVPPQQPIPPSQPTQPLHHASHGHQSPITGPFPTFHHNRGISRDDLGKQHTDAMREREEQERRWRQDADRRFEDEQHHRMFASSRRQQQEQELHQQQQQQQQMFGRPPHMGGGGPQHGPPFGGPHQHQHPHHHHHHQQQQQQGPPPPPQHQQHGMPAFPSAPTSRPGTGFRESALREAQSVYERELKQQQHQHREPMDWDRERGYLGSGSRGDPAAGGRERDGQREREREREREPEGLSFRRGTPLGGGSGGVGSAPPSQQQQKPAPSQSQPGRR